VQDVTTATHQDVEPLAEMLARAFDDDPVSGWFYRSLRSRPRNLQRFFAWQMRRLVAQEQVHMTADRAGAAVWALPDRWRETPMEGLRLLRSVGPALLPRLPLALAGIRRVEQHHPAERHLYLAVLGVEPERQGEGLGSALLRPGLDLCDTERIPAYLESSKERNVAFYGRFGFRVTEELRLPRGGPPVWLMWRDPR
jgi:ribosomal protein S18 acetylase RimI-like enzyme